eukprot:GSChrysophyteH1.ASY1.ANO1.1602.1 assembled CDS
MYSVCCRSRASLQRYANVLVGTQISTRFLCLTAHPGESGAQEYVKGQQSPSRTVSCEEEADVLGDKAAVMYSVCCRSRASLQRYANVLVGTQISTRFLCLTAHPGESGAQEYVKGQQSPSRTVSCEEEADLVRLGRRLGRIACRGDTLLLRGDLGSGKTTLARGVIQELLGDENGDVRVTSPSYLLCNSYTSVVMPSLLDIHHMDLFRLPTGSDVSFLGLPGLYAKSVCLVEWPERLREACLPRAYLDVDIVLDEELSCLDEEQQRRTVVLTPQGEGCGPRWEPRLGGF